MGFLNWLTSHPWVILSIIGFVGGLASRNIRDGFVKSNLLLRTNLFPKPPTLKELEQRSLDMELEAGLVFEDGVLQDGYDYAPGSAKQATTTATKLPAQKVPDSPGKPTYKHPPIVVRGPATITMINPGESVVGGNVFVGENTPHPCPPDERAAIKAEMRRLDKEYHSAAAPSETIRILDARIQLAYKLMLSYHPNKGRR